mmetsp:Transcript_7772/g.11114  ORF Transcript_7772/g.11114 Transcript_7772/m.11114 type:complete len:127 (+) Transcript_7772:1082-1462(+)
MSYILGLMRHMLYTGTYGATQEVLRHWDMAPYIVNQLVSRVVDRDGRPVGEWYRDLLFDTCIYELMFPDGTVEQYTSNLIIEAIYNEYDEEGQRHQLLRQIVNNEMSPDALDDNKGYTVGMNGKRK